MKRIFPFLQKAIEDRDLDAIESLFRDHPALCTYEDPDGTALGHLVKAGPDVLEAAFRGGMHPDSQQVIGMPLLHHVAAEGNLAVVAIAVRYGADLESRNKEGETALGYAVSWEHPEVVRFLVEAGADVNAVEEAPDGYRNTALDCCRNAQIEEYLRAHGAKKLEELKIRDKSSQPKRKGKRRLR